jgi:hypothetical protein
MAAMAHGMAHGGSGGAAAHIGASASNLHNFYHATMHVALLLACAAEAAERRWGAGAKPAATGIVPRGCARAAYALHITCALRCADARTPHTRTRRLGLAALAFTLWQLVALFAIHTLLQAPTEALRHRLLCAPLALAAAAATADVAAPASAWLLLRGYGLALAGAWMTQMALSRQYGWEERFEASPAAAQTVATLHFAWAASALAVAVAAGACGARASGGQGAARAARRAARDAARKDEGGDAPQEGELRRLMSA